MTIMSAPVRSRSARWPLQLLLVASTEVAAQTNAYIDAQQSQLQLQRSRTATISSSVAAPDVRLGRIADAAPDYPASETPCFPIRQISLEGADSAHFQWALKAVTSARGRCLGTAGVNAVMARVQNALIGAGFVTTRVVAPPQDLKSGTFALVLIPGRVGTIRFADPASGAVLVKTNYRNALPVKPGAVINLRDVEQGLENFKRIASADADIQMMPGSQAGESDLVIAWRQSRPWRVNLTLDDGGNKSTGKYQANITLLVDNPLRIHDLFYVSISNDLNGKEHGTRGHSVHYSLPYGYWLLSVSGNDYAYRQSVAGAIQSYTYRGNSDNLELKLSRLFWRDAVRKLSISLRAYRRNSRNFIDDTEVEVQRRRMGGFEFGLYGKQFVGRATVNGNVAFKRGLDAFGRPSAPEEVAGDGISRPRLINADLELSLPLALIGRQFDYQANWRAQWNRTALVAQDRFGIGGRYSVRGFDGESSLLSERGWLVRNDLGWRPAHTGQQIYLFLDYAQVGGAASASLAGTRLGGAGVGWRGQIKGLQYDLFAGKPVVKPLRFPTARVASGFNLGYLF
jgi:hemolysin activation/secretion protein